MNLSDKNDEVTKGLVSKLNIRFCHLALEDAWREIQSVNTYSESTLSSLGKLVAGSLLLKSNLKDDYSVHLQAQPEGGDFFVAHSRPCLGNSSYLIKGMARNGDNKGLESNELHGRMVVTISNKDSRIYQGIVEINNNNIEESLADYFTKSEQLQTWIKIYVKEDMVKGFLIQALPEFDVDNDFKRVQKYLDETESHGWNGQLSLNTPEQLVKDIFYDEEIKIFHSEKVEYSCTCSSKGIDNVLMTLGEKEVNDILRQYGEVSVDCEFCNKKYKYNNKDIQKLFRDSMMTGSDAIN